MSAMASIDQSPGILPVAMLDSPDHNRVRITGCRKLAGLAALFDIPIVTHCPGSLVHLLATAHFGACTRNFVMSENRIPQGGLYEEMAEGGIVVKDSALMLPDGPGLGIQLVAEVIKKNLLPGEPYWE